MASTTSPQASHSLPLRTHNTFNSTKQHPQLTPIRRAITTLKNNRRSRVQATAEGPRKRERAPPGVDTRIHWDDPDEGWIGGSSQQQKNEEEEDEHNNFLGQNFADLLNDASGSHYRFLGVSADSDIEEIKAAYRKLSKEYHPDTTLLPLKSASEKFMKLRQVYDVLSNEKKRKFYDWTLAQEAASRQAEKMRMKLQDPYQQELDSYRSVPDMVDRLGGRNMELSDQAMSALTIDAFIVIFAICCIIYVAFFQEPNYY